MLLSVVSGSFSRLVHLNCCLLARGILFLVVTGNVYVHDNTENFSEYKAMVFEDSKQPEYNFDCEDFHVA